MTRLRIAVSIGSVLIPWCELGTISAFASAFAFPAAGTTTSKPPRSACVSHRSLYKHGLHARKSSWSVSDDWSSLSSESPENAVPDTADIFNEDLASQAARLMEPATGPIEPPTKEEQWLNNAVDEVHNHGYVAKPSPSDPSLYDTFESYTQSVGFIDEMGHQISMLVNCNQRPEDLLIEEGRALPPLSDEEKNDVTQLVVQSEAGVYQPTDFFRQAITKIYMEHARSEKKKDSGEYDVFLDAAGVARWMTKCIGSETQGSVGPHDRRVLATLAKFAPYGTGRLGEEDFHRLYLLAVTDFLDGKTGRAGREMKMKLPTVESVWCDIRNHGILAPVEAERQQKADEIRAKYGASSPAETNVNAKGLATLMDECEIVEWLEDSKASSFTTRTTESNHVGDRRKKSSHELVELASDGKTPLRMRDGDFVFIDEESCIGCAQCASVCPSSFLMLETGRARTFSQRKAPDVPMAVSVCPVNCMHEVSFQELKEMEAARDEGDGRSDHRHLGHRRGHTPLSVSGIDSDANHRSSWYHYIKQKCHMSSDCPKRGCFDCPNFSAPGENPYFKQMQRKAEHVRAEDAIASGGAEMYRKTADL